MFRRRNSSFPEGIQELCSRPKTWIVPNSDPVFFSFFPNPQSSLQKRLNWKFSRWPRQSGACSTCPRRRGWGTWTSSAWRREGFWKDLTESPPCTNREIIENREPGCSSQCMVEGWETVEISWNERFGIDKRKNLLIWGQLDSGAGYAGRVYRLHPWRISRPDWIQLWAILFDVIADHALIRRFI